MYEHFGVGESTLLIGFFAWQASFRDRDRWRGGDLSNSGNVVLLLLGQLALPEVVHHYVDADVDGGADDEEQQPHVDHLWSGLNQCTV